MDSSPLNVGAASFVTHRLVWDGDRKIVLAPQRILRIIGAVLLAIGLLLVSIGTLPQVTLGDDALIRDPLNIAAWGIAALGVPFLLGAVCMFIGPNRFEFDFEEQRLRKTGFGGGVYSLQNVFAVQLIPGGWHGRNTVHTKRYFTYQVNLVLNDDDSTRVNLTNYSDWDASYAMASELADALDVELEVYDCGADE